MDVEFDGNKDLANQRKHGMSLAAASHMDFATAMVIADERRAYGEARYRAFGVIGDRLCMLAFTMRGSVMRAISLRKANARERRFYERGQG
jgi:uncharacterized DUF497 family protein